MTPAGLTDSAAAIARAAARQLAALAVLALALSPGGCGRRDELTLMVGGTPNEMAWWESMAREFTAETGRPVQWLRSTTQTEQRQQALTTALRGRRPDPDVLLVDVAWIAQFAASGWLEPLEAHGLDAAPFLPAVVRAVDEQGGHLVGLPLYVDGGLLYYRTDLLREHGFEGPPRTWSELAEISRAVAGTSRGEPWGFAWPGAQYEGLVCFALEVFASAGGGFLDDTGRPALDREANRRALETMASFVRDGISPPNTYTEMHEEEVRLLFQEGHAVFERNWPYAWALHHAADSPVRNRFGVAPLPGFTPGSGVSCLGGWHVAISAFSDCKSDASKLVAYLTSRKAQKRMALELGWNPGRAEVYDDAEVLREYPVLPELREIFARAVARPAVPYYAEISAALQGPLNAAIAGRVAPAEALRSAQAAVEAIVARQEEAGSEER